jgi:hypothetical protein
MLRQAEKDEPVRAPGPDVFDDPLDHRPAAQRYQRFGRGVTRVGEPRTPPRHWNDDLQCAH